MKYKMNIIGNGVESKNEIDNDYIIVDPPLETLDEKYIDLDSPPKVSFVIPTFNNEDTLAKTLRSIITQDYPDFEIIIVDGYSKDKTIEIAKKYTDKIFFDEGTYGSACQTGVEHSTGEILGLFDSDIIFPHGTWLMDAMKYFNYSERVSTVWPDQNSPPDGFHITKLHFNLYKIIIDARIRRKRGLFGGGNSLITKKSICEIGGIDKNIHWGADFDWAQKLKHNQYQVVFIKDCIYHNTMRSIKEFTKKQFVGAKTFTKTGLGFMNLSFSDVVYEHIIGIRGMIIGLIKDRDVSWLFYPYCVMTRLIAFIYTYLKNIVHHK